MNVKRITSSEDAVLTGIYKLAKVRLVSTTGVVTALLYDAITQTGTDFCKMSTEATGCTDQEDFGKVVKTSTGLSVTITGTGILYVYYE